MYHIEINHLICNAYQDSWLPNSHVLLRPSLILPTPSLFQNFSKPPLPHLHYSFSLSPCFFDCMGDSSIFDVLFCLMIWTYTCQALVTQSQKDLAVCPMQQGVKVTEVWHTLFFASNLIWYHTQTHTHIRHKEHSGPSRLAHPY